MCQSKAKGGFRCATHVKDAIADHKNKYSQIVQQECIASGITINPECFELTPKEKMFVTSQVFLDPSAQIMRKEIAEANHQVRVLQATFTDALAVRDINKLAVIIRAHNPELKAIADDDAARKRRYEESITNTNLDEGEIEKVLAYNENQRDLLNKRKAKLNFLSRKEALESLDVFSQSCDVSKALALVTCVNQAQKDALAVQDKAAALSQRARTRLTETIITNKLINDPGFKAAESSDAFRNSAKFHEWEKKEKELAESYRMTPGYQKKVVAKIADYKKLGMDTTEMETAYRALTVRKAQFAYRNVAAAYGTFSPEAKVAKEAYYEAKQKEISF